MELTKKGYYEKDLGLASVYRGYVIRKIRSIHRVRSKSAGKYFKDSVQKANEYYAVVKEGYQHVKAFYISYEASTIEDAKRLIDNIVDDGEIFLTIGETQEWVNRPNHKHKWGFSRNMCYSLISSHEKSSNPRRKRGYELRLEDANFHNLCGLLIEERYDEAREWVRQNYALQNTKK